MSIDETVVPVPDQVLVREATLEIAEGDGRTLEARIVPYGETATICDPPDFVVEEERFAPGCADRQIRAAHRVKMWLTTLHEEGLRGIVGHAEKLEERADGLYATFRVHDNKDGDKALQLVRDGLLPSMSVEFKALQSLRRNGIVERVRVHIDKSSLVPVGAYANAGVLALREKALAAHQAEADMVVIDGKEIANTVLNAAAENGTAAPVVELPRMRSLPESLAYDLAARGFKLQEDSTEASE
jgi:HK97 family phage prohead protease